MLLRDIFPKSKTQYPDVVNKYSVVDYTKGLRMRDRVQMVCSDCGQTFIQRANNVFSQGIISCRCSKFYRKTQDELLLSAQEACSLNNLEFKDIIYVRPLTKSKILFECKVCFNKSDCRYETLVHGGVGCTFCTKKYHASRDEYVAKLESIFQNSFTLYGPLPEKVNNKTTVSVQCLNCEEISSKTIAAIIYHKASCQCMATYGYDNSKPGYMYLISLTDNSNTFYKVGITCNTTRRFRELSNTNNLDVGVLCIWDYPENGPILEHELFLKNHFGMGRSDQKPFEYGYTESVSEQSLPILMAVQNLQYRNI